MTSLRVSKGIELDYGHTLPNHSSFCSQLHGHRAKVIATVSGAVCTTDGDSSQGMVLDFKFLKEIMTLYIHDVLDHGFAVWKESLDDVAFIVRRNKKYLLTDEPPTAEYLAKWAYAQIVDKIPIGMTLEKLVWYETPSSAAIYTRDLYLSEKAAEYDQTSITVFESLVTEPTCKASGKSQMKNMIKSVGRWLKGSDLQE